MQGFSQELALSIVRSDDAFPVPFDDAWKWIGYFKKQEAKNRLLRHFEKGLDFEDFTQVPQNSTEQASQPNLGGRPAENIMLSTDCFKSLAMMAGTAKGKEVRRYFLDCERQLKAANEEQIKVLKGTVFLKHLMGSGKNPTPALRRVERARDLIYELKGELDDRDRSLLLDMLYEGLGC